MLVKEYMTPNPMTVKEDSSILETAELMKKHKVRRFPVLRDDELIGIVTDRDLRSAAPSQVISFDAQERELMPELHSLLSGITVKEVMSRDVLTIHPEQTIVAAAQLMLEHRMSGHTRGGLRGASFWESSPRPTSSRSWSISPASPRERPPLRSSSKIAPAPSRRWRM